MYRHLEKVLHSQLLSRSVHPPLSQWCIFPPISTKFINFPPIIVQFTFFCLINNLPPVFWPWCIYASWSFTHSGCPAAWSYWLISRGHTQYFTQAVHHQKIGTLHVSLTRLNTELMQNTTAGDENKAASFGRIHDDIFQTNHNRTGRICAVVLLEGVRRNCGPPQCQVTLVLDLIKENDCTATL